MTHRERKKRRREIAEAAESGEPYESIAKRFGVAKSTISHACKEFGIQSPNEICRSGINVSKVSAFLYDNPWSTRTEIEKATSIDTRSVARIILEHMDLRKRVRAPNKKRPMEYALPEVGPNPFKPVQDDSNVGETK